MASTTPQAEAEWDLLGCAVGFEASAPSEKKPRARRHASNGRSSGGGRHEKSNGHSSSSNGHGHGHHGADESAADGSSRGGGREASSDCG